MHVGYASNKRAWWLCRTCQNEWQVQISNRSAGGVLQEMCEQGYGETKARQLTRRWAILPWLRNGIRR